MGQSSMGAAPQMSNNSSSQNSDDLAADEHTELPKLRVSDEIIHCVALVTVSFARSSV